VIVENALAVFSTVAGLEAGRRLTPTIDSRYASGPFLGFLLYPL
jgi:hypothetical protein